ncbi:unnamed protein product, partial [Protopolystoma xenopodis]
MRVNVPVQEAYEALDIYHKKMIKLTEEQFDLAVNQGDKANIQLFAKIFPLIGRRNEGLERFGNYIRSLISTKMEQYTHQNHCRTQSSISAPFVDMLTRLLEAVAEILKDNLVYIETFYGPGHVFTITKSAQAECDRQARRIVDSFRSLRHLDAMTNAAQHCLASHSAGVSAFNEAAASGCSSVESVISEIVTANSRVDLYLRFVKRRIAHDISQTDTEISEKQDKSNQAYAFFNQCELVRLMQNLVGNYVVLEGFFLHSMVLK